MAGLAPARQRIRAVMALLACSPLSALAQTALSQTTLSNGSTASAAPAMENVALTVDGINATSGEDNPGVVYILPWQPPTLPRRTRDALETNTDDLLEPVNPEVFERHQEFQQSMNPTLDSTTTRP